MVTSILMGVTFGLIVPLLAVFFVLSFHYKKIGIYLTGMIMANIYLLGATEGLVFAFKKKMGFMLKMFINPYKGSYSIFTMNFHYNKVLLISVWVASLVLLAIAFARSKQELKKEAKEEAITSSVSEFIDNLEEETPLITETPTEGAEPLENQPLS